MSMYKNLTTVCAAVVLAFGLAACGDNDDGPSTMMDDTPAMDLAWDMLDGETIEPGTYAISSAPADLLDDAADVVVPEGGFVPGSMVELGGYVLTCSGTVNCSVTVDDEDNVMTTGTIMVMAKMDTVDPVDPVDPTVPMADAVTLPADLPETLPAAEGEIMIAAGMSEDSGGVMFSCAADGEACVVTVDADGMATSTGGTVTATLTMAAQEVVDEAATKMAMEMRDRAISQSAALATGGELAATLRISNSASKDTSVKSTGYTPAEMAAMTISGWSGHALTNTSSAAATQHLVVYTDIGEPKKAPFYTTDDVPPKAGVYESHAGHDNGVLTITGHTGTAATNNNNLFTAGNLDLTVFPKAGPAADGVVTQSFKLNATGMGTSTPGLFDGARGTYTCVAGTADGSATASCSVSVTSAGSYTSNGVWTFTPNAGAMAYREDSEFLRFGWWMSEPTRSTGAYNFAAFYNGTPYTPMPTSDATGVRVGGDATYTGNAAGRYVAGDEAGAFTATATLTAKFGDGGADDTEVGTISGMIDKFQGGEGMSAWTVSLEEIDLTTLAGATAFESDNFDRNSSGYNGTIATMGDVTAHGKWEGKFFGNKKTPSAANVADAQPLAVGGRFDAAGSGASIAGAYGARR